MVRSRRPSLKITVFLSTESVFYLCNCLVTSAALHSFYFYTVLLQIWWRVASLISWRWPNNKPKQPAYQVRKPKQTPKDRIKYIASILGYRNLSLANIKQKLWNSVYDYLAWFCFQEVNFKVVGHHSPYVIFCLGTLPLVYQITFC